jgi:hypothetical protein
MFCSCTCFSKLKHVCAQFWGDLQFRDISLQQLKVCGEATRVPVAPKGVAEWRLFSAHASTRKFRLFQADVEAHGAQKQRYDARDDARDRDGREDRRARVYDERDRDDPREGLMRDLDLPREEERELVDVRDRVYELDGDDSRTLAAVGAFRVVLEHDLDIDHETLDHLHDEGLVETVDLGDDNRGLTLTREGRDLLDSHAMGREDEPTQDFYAGVSRERELDHDSNLYAYRQEEARLRDEHGGLEVRRVVLDHDLKREYQEFLQAHNRGRSDSDGRPDRDEHEIREWAREHDLPYFDGQVLFPDYHIEYEMNGREHHQDVELFTEHYRGAHAASYAQTGFRIYVVGSRGGGGRSGPHPRLMEEFL